MSARFAVWKYDLPIGDEVVVELPEGAEVLHVGNQFEVNISTVTIWVRCQTEPAPRLEKRRFLIRGTGHPVGDEPYIGTVRAAQGTLIWHVFDGGLA